jgi:hypothetical protein
MRRLGLTVGVLLSLTGVALAAPGFPRTVQGTLEWPASLEGAPFILVRADDGRVVYVNVQDARRTGPGNVVAGNRVSAVGVEGTQPHEISALRVGPGDSAIPGEVFSPPPMPSASQPSAAASSAPTVQSTTPAPGPPAETLWRLRGTVQSVTGTSVTLRTSDGATHTVDVSNLSQATRGTLKAGDEVSLYGVPQRDRRLIATGFVQSEGVPAAASPRTEPRR